MSDPDRTRVPNPHCRTCADGPHTGMHDLPPARSARVWTRALGTVRDVRFGVYQARVESAAGQVDGVRIEGHTFHGKAAMRRTDLSLDLLVPEARTMHAALGNVLAVVDAPDPDEKRRQVEALADALRWVGDGSDGLRNELATWAYELGARVR
jgi:hypothetical protein